MMTAEQQQRQHQHQHQHQRRQDDEEELAELELADSDAMTESAAESVSDAEDTTMLGALLEVTPALEVDLEPSRHQRAGSTGLAPAAKARSMLARRLSKRHITSPAAGESLATVSVPPLDLAAELGAAADKNNNNNTNNYGAATMPRPTSKDSMDSGFAGDSPRSAPGDPRRRPMSWAYPGKPGAAGSRQMSNKFSVPSLRGQRPSKDRRPSVHQRKSSLSGSYPAPASPSKPHQSPFDPPTRPDASFKAGAPPAGQRRRLAHYSTATSWVPKSLAPNCYGCKTKFWWMAPNWTKHHCRKDGNVYCNSCTQWRVVLEPGTDPVRVCRACFIDIKGITDEDAAALADSAAAGASAAAEPGAKGTRPPQKQKAKAASAQAAAKTDTPPPSQPQPPSTQSPASPVETASSWMLPGEELVGHFENLWFENEPRVSVLLTTFQLIIFDSTDAPLRAVAHIPLMSIERIEILLNDVCEAGVLNIYCKNLRFLRLVVFGMVSEQRFSTFHELEHALVRLVFPTEASSKHETFACVLRYAIVDTPPSGADLLHFSGCCLDYHVDDLAELRRLVDGNPGWRISEENKSFALCASYPRFLGVPSKISDAELKLVADFRIRRRIPILSWLDPDLKLAVCRCSQPKSGPWYRRSIADEKLIREIAIAGKSGLVIVDARPPSNANANRIKTGGGFEDVANYNSHTGQAPVSIEFMNLENTNTVRASMNKLKRLVGHRLKQQRKFVLGAHGKFELGNAHMHPGSFALDDEEAVEFEINWLSKLADSRWVHLLSYIIKASCRVVQIIKDERKSVLVHCSDGWDRTAQIVSLAVLCMDARFRTLRGFISLLERDWLSVGHAFRTRYATGAPPGPKSTREVIEHSSSHVAPVFVQFMDCVFQLQQQFPTAFEFNDQLLITVLDRLYSAQFGNFLVNSRKEAVDHQLPLTSFCAWDDFFQEPELFYNPSYEPRAVGAANGGGEAALRPAFGTKHLQLWRSYYLRFDETCRDDDAAAWASSPVSSVASSQQTYPVPGLYSQGSDVKRAGSFVEVYADPERDARPAATTRQQTSEASAAASSVRLAPELGARAKAVSFASGEVEAKAGATDEQCRETHAANKEDLDGSDNIQVMRAQSDLS